MTTAKNQTNRINPEELKRAVKQINTYFDQFKKIFVGRETLIDLVKYAMLQKSHVLFFGHPGTAKTQIADSIFAGIEGAKKFDVQLTAFMAEESVFGPYNIKKMREEGVLEHNVSGMLPEANFANMDELLDANPAMLRSMLSALNERRMVKGRQVLDLPLHLAYCSSNVDPYLFMKRNPQAWAVFDRISFIGKIDYLETAEDVAEMVKRFQYGTSNQPRLSLDLSMIQSVCDYVLMPPTIIQDQIMFLKYGEAVIEYRKQRKDKMIQLEKDALENSKGEFDLDYQGIIFKDISDRRVCWGSQMIELQAILSGRISTEPEDMLAAHYVLGTSEIEKQLWIAIVNQKVQEIHDLKKNQLSELQLKQVQIIADQFEDISSNGHDLETRINGISTLARQLKEIQPDNDKVEEMFKSLSIRIESYRAQVGEELLDSKGLKTENN